MEGLLVVRLQLVAVLLLDLLLGEVDVESDLLVLLELHDHKGISSLALPQRRIKANAEHDMRVVGLGQHHELLDGIVLDLVVVCFSAEAKRRVVHVDVEPSSGCEVQAVEELGNRIASRLADFGLFHEGLVKERHGVLFLLAAFCVAGGLLAIDLLLGDRSGHVETHLDELVLTSCGLFPRFPSAAQCAVGACIVDIGRQGELHGNLVATCQICVGDFGVGNLEGGSVLHVEGKLRLAKVGLAPIPAAEGVLLVLKRRAVPVLEDLAKALVILQQDELAVCMPMHVSSAHLLLEAVQLNDSGLAILDPDLISLCGTAPLCGRDVALVEREGVSPG